MKKITLMALTGMFLSITACEKDASAPQNVQDTFAKKFPTAKNVEWEKESDTEWEAEFELKGKKYSSNFKQDGTWTETEYEIAESEIPQVVMSALKSDFDGYDIEEMELSETGNGTVYEFSIEKDEFEMEISINANGTIVKKQQKKESDDD